MKQKKLVIYFFILSIALTLVLPVLNLSFTYSKYKKINLQSFSKQQLFSTNNLESIRNYFVYNMFNYSLNEAQVIAGKDNFLFLGNQYARVIDNVKGTFSYDSKDIDIWAAKLKKLQDWYEKQGIQFIIVVASNKHTIYSDKLPDSIQYKEGETLTDDIVKSSLNKNIHILNLKKALREKKEAKQLYFYTGTHWNNYGAFIGYVNTIGYLNTKYKENYKIANFPMTETTQGGNDLTNFLKINHLLSNSYEKNYRFIFKQKKVRIGKITKNYKLAKYDPSIKINGFDKYIINEHSLNKQKLLYLCDSFGGANTQFYTETFNTVWRLHHRYLNASSLAGFIQKHKPDIVIYQIVERGLYDNSIVEDMSKVSKSEHP